MKKVIGIVIVLAVLAAAIVCGILFFPEKSSDTSITNVENSIEETIEAEVEEVVENLEEEATEVKEELEEEIVE